MYKPMTINHSRGSYTVNFPKDFKRLEKILLTLKGYALIDSTVLRHHPWLNQMNWKIIEVLSGEESKTLKYCSNLIADLFEAGFEWGEEITVIGGGTVQDCASFMASILKRGYPWNCIPTTLLAQCDSCIGSKTSVNHGRTKNILGTFHPPTRVFVCTEFLTSLPSYELLSGYGEIIKIAELDCSPDWYQSMIEYIAKGELLNEHLSQFIRYSLKVKKQYIERDEFDLNVRRLLNCGHTFGHAIEAATEFTIPHGIAVIYGIMLAHRVADNRNIISTERVEKFKQIHNLITVDFPLKSLDKSSFQKAIEKDKKVSGGKIRYILPENESGYCLIDDGNIEEALTALAKEMKDGD